jgi:hypothetical protein
MDLIPVQSSMVTHVGHDGHALHLVYKGGKHYVHPEVSAEKYKELLASPSKGEFINKHIKTQHPGVAKR